jgi:transketolase
MDRTETEGMSRRGGYVVRDGEEFTIVATGSEVSLAIATVERLGRGRVVSMPCVEAFDDQEVGYQRDVLGTDPIVTLEAGTTFGWHRFAGSNGLTIGIDTFGASAPAGVLADHFGFTPEQVATKITEWLTSTE